MHRPYPPPNASHVMHQTWHDLLFMHWRVPAESLRQHLPTALSLDTFDDSAWIGIVPFRMSDVRPRFLPALPWLSAFPELNVRTYVTLDGRPGVWFFSLDAGNPLAVWIARAWFKLPYFTADITSSTRGRGGFDTPAGALIRARRRPNSLPTMARSAMSSTRSQAHWNTSSRRAIACTRPTGTGASCAPR